MHPCHFDRLHADTMKDVLSLTAEIDEHSLHLEWRKISEHFPVFLEHFRSKVEKADWPNSYETSHKI